MTAPALTLVIPMAGEGSRFAKAGYAKPKPFIDVAGQPMIARVFDNLMQPGFQPVLIARTAHLAAEPATVAALTNRYQPKIVQTDGVTQGAACTVLLAKDHFNNDTPMLMANSDQIVDFSVADFVQDAKRRGLDGSILTFREPGRNPKWSYARTDAAGMVTEVREKVAISEQATVGIYYFARGRDFAAAAEAMIAANDRHNNEFYVAPVYNYAIKAGLKVGVYDIPQAAMHGIGTPEDLQVYLRLMVKEG